MPTPKPRPLPVRFDTLPPALVAIPRWVVWRYEWKPDTKLPKGGKWDKPPRTPKGAAASTTNAATWATFADARAAYERGKWDGVGFVFAADDAIFGLDLDDKAGEGKYIDSDGNPTPAARALLDGLDTFTEISPSGFGLHAYGFAELPGKTCRKDDIEMYQAGRYFTLTGHVLGDYPGDLMERQSEAERLYESVFAAPAAQPQTVPRRPAPAVLPDDAELLKTAFGSKNGAAIEALYNGDMSAYQNDHSRADAALCAYLAFYSDGDPARLDGWFRNSRLWREKWDTMHGAQTYGDLTINRAIERTKEFYTPPLSADERRAKTKAEREEKAEKRAELRRETAQLAQNAEGLPVIETNAVHLRDMAGEALRVLLDANDPPTLFVRGGKLTRINTDETNRATVTPIEPDMLTYQLARVANFVSTSDDRGTVPCVPPVSIVRDILAAPRWVGIPPLVGLVTAPIMASDGTLYAKPGYQSKTRLYYHERDSLPIGDTTPTPANVRAALDLLLGELFCDFPFVRDATDAKGRPLMDGETQISASRANALALLLLPFARQMIDGTTPFHLIDAPAAGTGKSLLAELVTEIFQPGGASKIQAPTNRDGDSDNEEWRKRITAALQDGGPFFFIDNISGVLKAASFDSLLTATEWKDRVLGQTKDIVLPVRCVFIGTANNAEVRGDTARRTVWIRLDSGQESPDERDGFKIPDIRAYVRANRPRLIGAALTLLRCWVERGRKPWSGTPIGSYEAWSATMGGILEACGVTGFLANREEMKARLNPERELWSGFFKEWYGANGSAPKVAADVAALAVAAGIINDAEKGRTSLGRLLRARVDTVSGKGEETFRLVAYGAKKHGAVQYCVEKGEVTEVREVIPTQREGVSNYQNKGPRNNAGDTYKATGQNLPKLPNLPPESEIVTATLTILRGKYADELEPMKRGERLAIHAGRVVWVSDGQAVHEWAGPPNGGPVNDVYQWEAIAEPYPIPTE